MTNLEKIVSLCKRRGFVFPGSEIYGGLANTWDFGPLGLALKKNIKELWWREFVEKEENVYGIDGGIILSPKVWEASGHVENFTDPLVECKKCHHRFRADQLEDKSKCPDCGGQLTEPRMFNGMFRTSIGPTEDSTSMAFLRPETAQAIFINFKNILDTFHPKLPFGIAQIGKSFRNEITAGNFIFRDLEFEQMELEYFIDPKNGWEKEYDKLLKKMRAWVKLIGLDDQKIKEREHDPKERSHYSKKTIDIEYQYPFGIKELYGLAYRTDFDLSTHTKHSGVDLVYRDDKGKELTPHVIEPSFGVERTFLAILDSAFTEEEKRIVLKLKPQLAPYKAAVFPLLANKPELIKKAKEVFKNLKSELKSPIAWDDRGNIGKRYLSQDEIGTPFCITVDFDTLEDDAVTVRDRDTTRQERIKIINLPKYLEKALG